jgi:spermidine synthase
LSTDIQISEEAGVRSLHFGPDLVQGAMRVARPWSLELDYTRDMMAALLLRPEPDWPRKALLIGLGAASQLKFLHRHRPAASLTVVEIDPAIIAAARQYFKLPDDPQRIRLVVGDGAEFVTRRTGSYDFILVDGFNADGRPGQLDTPEFYENCRTRLSRDGVLAVNLLSRRRGFRESVVRIAEAFAGRACIFPSCDSGNAIAFAAVGDAVRLTLAEMRDLARELKHTTGLNLLPTVSRLEEAKFCRGGELLL